MAWASLRSKPISYHLEKRKTGYLMLETGDGKHISLSPSQRRFLGAVSRLANPLRSARRALLGRLARRAEGWAPLEDGYATLTAVPGHEQAIAVCEQQMAIYLDFLERGDAALKARNIDCHLYHAEMKKTATDPLKHVPVLYDKAATSALLGFGLNPIFVAAASERLGVLPILSGLRILYSPNAPGELASAQLLHMDPEGARQMKVFVAVREVRKENSPFTFLPESVTRRLLAGDEVFTSNRIPDKFLKGKVLPEEWVRHTGAPGDALLIDTSNCFHYGSRPNAKPRLLLYYSFHDPFGSLYALNYPGEQKAKPWSFFTGRPHRFTDWLLSRRV